MPHQAVTLWKSLLQLVQQMPTQNSDLRTESSKTVRELMLLLINVHKTLSAATWKQLEGLQVPIHLGKACTLLSASTAPSSSSSLTSGSLLDSFGLNAVAWEALWLYISFAGTARVGVHVEELQQCGFLDCYPQRAAATAHVLQDAIRAAQTAAAAGARYNKPLSDKPGVHTASIGCSRQQQRRAPSAVASSSSSSSSSSCSSCSSSSSSSTAQLPCVMAHLAELMNDAACVLALQPAVLRSWACLHIQTAASAATDKQAAAAATASAAAEASAELLLALLQAFSFVLDHVQQQQQQQQQTSCRACCHPSRQFMGACAQTAQQCATALGNLARQAEKLSQQQLVDMPHTQAAVIVFVCVMRCQQLLPPALREDTSSASSGGGSGSGSSGGSSYVGRGGGQGSRVDGFNSNPEFLPMAWAAVVQGQQQQQQQDGQLPETAAAAALLQSRGVTLIATKWVAAFLAQWDTEEQPLMDSLRSIGQVMTARCCAAQPNATGWVASEGPAAAATAASADTPGSAAAANPASAASSSSSSGSGGGSSSSVGGGGCASIGCAPCVAQEALLLTAVLLDSAITHQQQQQGQGQLLDSQALQQFGITPCILVPVAALDLLCCVEQSCQHHGKSTAEPSTATAAAAAAEGQVSDLLCPWLDKTVSTVVQLLQYTLQDARQLCAAAAAAAAAAVTTEVAASSSGRSSSGGGSGNGGSISISSGGSNSISSGTLGPLDMRCVAAGAVYGAIGYVENLSTHTKLDPAPTAAATALTAPALQRHTQLIIALLEGALRALADILSCGEVTPALVECVSDTFVGCMRLLLDNSTQLVSTVAQTPAGSPEQLQLFSCMSSFYKFCYFHGPVLEAYNSVIWYGLVLGSVGVFFDLFNVESTDVVKSLPNLVLAGRYQLLCAQQLRQLQLGRPNLGQQLLLLQRFRSESVAQAMPDAAAALAVHPGHAAACLVGSEARAALLVETVGNHLQAQEVQAQLVAAGYTQDMVGQVMQQVDAAVAALDALAVAATAAAAEAAYADIVRHIEGLGLMLNRFATPQVCNNPYCSNVAKLTELETVSGRSCMCGGCRVAHYCCRGCQRAHWKQHKPVCQALAAAGAAAAAAAAGATE